MDVIRDLSYEGGSSIRPGGCAFRDRYHAGRGDLVVPDPGDVPVPGIPHVRRLRNRAPDGNSLGAVPQAPRRPHTCGRADFA